MRRVVIVGGGAAGYSAGHALAKALGNRRDVTLSLISRQPHFVVRPLLPEVVTGRTAPQFALVELAELRNHGRIQIHTAEVKAIDVAERTVLTDSGAHGFDYLLITLGGEASPPTEWSDDERVYSLSDDIESARLRHRLAAARDQETALAVAVVGGGPVGVDLAAALAERGLAERPEVTLFEAADRLLAAYPEPFSQYASATLQDLGVELELGEEVGLGEDGLYIGRERVLDPDVIIWAGGLRSLDVLDRLEDKPSVGGRLPVDEYLRVGGRPDLFAAGSSARVDGLDPDHFGIQVSADMGRLAAGNLVAAMSGRAPQPFTMDGRLLAVAMGQRRAVAQPFGYPVTGRPAWALYRASLARAVPDLMARLGIVGTWAQQWFRDMFSGDGETR